MSELSSADLEEKGTIGRLERQLRRAENQLRSNEKVIRWCDEAVHQLIQTSLTHAQKEGVLIIISNKLNSLTAHEYHRIEDNDIPF